MESDSGRMSKNLEESHGKFDECGERVEDYVEHAQVVGPGSNIELEEAQTPKKSVKNGKATGAPLK